MGGADNRQGVDAHQEGRFAGRSHLSRVVQESSSVLMVDTFSGPRRVSAGSGYSGWSAEETWWPGWMGQIFEEAIEHGPKDVRSVG